MSSGLLCEMVGTIHYISLETNAHLLGHATLDSNTIDRFLHLDAAFAASFLNDVNNGWQ